MNKAAFFDRDGTINKDTKYLFKAEELLFIDGMPEFIKKWNQWGYLVIVITNQSGIARGYYTKEDMDKLHLYMNSELKKIGAHIDAFYYCPHHPDITGPCNCRKPATGMLEQAIDEWNIDPLQSVLFGDKKSDIEAAEKCGIRGILVR